MQNSSPHRSSIGQLNANSVAALCYGITLILFFIRGFQFCAWLLPLAVYILEKESAFVKFHAFQAFLLNISSAVIKLLIRIVWRTTHTAYSFFLIRFMGTGLTLALNILGSVISILVIIFAIIGLAKSSKYEYYKIPIIGEISNHIL